MSNETATLVKLSAAEQAAAVKKGDVMLFKPFQYPESRLGRINPCNLVPDACRGYLSSGIL